MLKTILKKGFGLFGFQLKKINPIINDSGISIDMIEPEFLKIYETCKKYSTCTVEPMYSLFKSVEYIAKNKISGDFVECGVFKGGSSMLIALTLLHFNDSNRKIYLYDTFEGMPPPTNNDKDFNNSSAEHLLNITKSKEENIWCLAPIEEVKSNMESTGYDSSNIIYVKGKVEETIPETMPSKIALLRLDTDWYESTKHELIHLYPLLVKTGVLIIDDYGHWKGARKAVDDFFDKQENKILLNRIDYTVRTGIKV